MTGFVLPDSWSSLSRSVKNLVAHIKRPVEIKSEDASLSVVDLATQDAPIQEPASQQQPASPRPYEVNLRESAFTSVFSLSGKAAKTIDVLRPEATEDVLQVAQEVKRPYVLLVNEDLEEMERDLSCLSSLTSVLNVAAAQSAGFKLDEKAQLQIIKGIGPKILSRLNAAGVLTFSDLADYAVHDLRKILKTAGPYHHLAKPASWIQQANLASMNQWDALKTLQASGPIRRRSKIPLVLKSVELNP